MGNNNADYRDSRSAGNTTDLRTALSQTEIISVLLTGSRDTDLTGRQMKPHRHRHSLLAGQAGQELAGQAREVLNYDLRLEPVSSRLKPTIPEQGSHWPGFDP